MLVREFNQPILVFKVTGIVVEILNRLHAKGSTKPGLDCECYPSCTEPEYNVIQSQRL